MIKISVLRAMDGFIAFERLDLRTRFIALLVVVILLVSGLSYREWYVQRKEAVRLEREMPGDRVGQVARGKTEPRVHTLQVAAFPSSKQAGRVIQSIRKKGVRGIYLVKTKRKAGGHWYKIRVGRFDSKEEARQFADQLVDQKTIRNYFIIPLPIN